jgi:type VI secretion system secreted protein Hcp
MKKTFKNESTTIPVIVTLILLSTPVRALAQQVDYFLLISGISGESVDAQHPNWIDISSTSVGIQGVPPQTSFGDFSFVSKVSSASPALLSGLASGQHFASAVLAVRRRTQSADYLKYTLTDALVTSDRSASGDASSIPTEAFSLTYSKIQIEYRPTRPDGSLGPPIVTCWDVSAGGPCSG